MVDFVRTAVSPAIAAWFQPKRRRARRISSGRPVIDWKRIVYYQTWDMEGSLTRRGARGRRVGGTAGGAGVPGPR
ncbi:MAG: hypothetical protein K2R98_07810, partial [Gemmataceae bacterium]|nr:hypothetical protein [Gemmataceae bacterium]